MRHQDVAQIKKARDAALEKYKSAMNNLQNPELAVKAAQEANDAWLEYKRMNVEFDNCSILQKLGDLYGC